MTTSRQLSKLFNAISDRDWKRVDDVAGEICRVQEDRGHFGIAKTLRGSLHANMSRSGDARMPLTEVPNQNGSMFLNSLKRLTGTARLDQIRLRRSTRLAFDELLAEFQHRDELEKIGLGVRRSLLFYGPPGVGKSLTAEALGNELGMPVYLVRFETIIGAYLGQTAINLRQIFQFAEATSCVLLIDEIDALGKQRGNPLDVGELDRVVIALMQELEHSQPKGLVIATSNVPKQLDQALWRRFDLVVEFPSPNRVELMTFSREQAKRHSLRFTKSLESAIACCKNYSDAEGIILNQARKALIQRIEEANGQDAT